MKPSSPEIAAMLNQLLADFQAQITRPSTQEEWEEAVEHAKMALSEALPGQIQWIGLTTQGFYPDGKRFNDYLPMIRLNGDSALRLDEKFSAYPWEEHVHGWTSCLRYRVGVPISNARVEEDVLPQNPWHDRQVLPPGWVEILQRSAKVIVADYYAAQLDQGAGPASPTLSGRRI